MNNPDQNELIGQGQAAIAILPPVPLTSRADTKTRRILRNNVQRKTNNIKSGILSVLLWISLSESVKSLSSFLKRATFLNLLKG